MRYRITEISSDFLERARSEGLDDQGQAVKRLVASGGEPCRDVLRRARQGELLILASYSPFRISGPYREYGPVFVLADESGEQPPLTQLPLREERESDPYLRDSFVLRAYNAAEEIVGARMVSPQNADDTISEMFSGDEVSFIHVRFPTYGCYALRIDRPL